MTDDEALFEIERWFASLEETKRKTEVLVELQLLAKTQPDEARRKLTSVNNHALKKRGFLRRSDNTIKYLKNKDSGGRDVPVDMDEFLMIKLQCHTL